MKKTILVLVLNFLFISGNVFTCAGEEVKETRAILLFENVRIYCLGHVAGNRWLDGLTESGGVQLAPVTTGKYTGTHWNIYKLSDGSYGFKCLGHVAGNRWLDGLTESGGVQLAPATTGKYTGTHWNIVKLSDTSYGIKCLGHVAGNRWLDGLTESGGVQLAPATTGKYTGTHWEIIGDIDF